MTDSGVRRLIQRGKLKSVQYGRAHLIRPDDLAIIKKSAAGRPRKTPPA